MELPLLLLLLLLFNPILAKTKQSTDQTKETKSPRLRVFTVATQVTDGFVRFNRSANVYGLKVEVLGLGDNWAGGDVRYHPGGGQKVNLLKKALERYKTEEDLVVLFVDSYDVIFTGNENQILQAFDKMGAKIVFSAESFCWPDVNLASEYPLLNQPNGGGKRYLNSGGFLGFAPQLYQMVTNKQIKDAEDDQLLYTKIYLNKDLRSKWSIKLDHKADLFQNLNGAVGDVELRFSDDDAFIHNTAYNTYPLIVHGNGGSKVILNSLGNYLAKSWNPSGGCLACEKSVEKISLKKKKPDVAPLVLIGVFIEKPTPFLPEFFEDLTRLRYPKKRIAIFIHNPVGYHNLDVGNFVKDQTNSYNQITVLPVNEEQKEWQARNLALEECLKIDCDHYLSLDSEARLTNPKALISLIEENKTVIAPMLVRPNKLWSNFWGALSAEGFYARSFDYTDIVKNKRKGVWNVPYISQAYLIKGSFLKASLLRPEDEGNTIDGTSSATEPFPTFFRKEAPTLDPDMAFSSSLRDNGVFIFVSNQEDYGHLINSDLYDISYKHNELREIHNNQLDWERRYIHENYSQVLREDYKFEEPCTDVYWFPVLSPLFCEHLIEEMENHGKWSDGTNSDPRLAGGYENVPTRDIHMNQVGLEQHWLYFLREYIRPVQEKIFIGYYHDPPRSIMNFVVRYHPDEQPFLRPHHDSSTYTINVALNRPVIDYEGGGCRFIRQNCTVSDLRLGWALLHPGRLTHYHEGLLVTKGTRYIMISFIDP